MAKILKRIDINDIFILTGLSSVGAGLFLWCGLGISLTITGAITLCMGYLSGLIDVDKK